MARYDLWGVGLLIALSACGGDDNDEPDGNSASGGAATGGALTGGAGTGGVATGGALTGGALTGGAATGGATTGGAATGGIATGGTATGGVITGGATTGGESTGGMTTGGATTGGESTGGVTTGGVTTGGVTTGGVTTGGVTTGGAATGGDGGVATGGTGGGQTSGCGIPGAPTGVQNRQVVIAGAARTYVLSVPSSYSSDTPLSLVFAWHGLGGNGALARIYFGVEGRSGGEAIFVYPDALPNGEGQAAWDLGAAGVDVQLFDTLLADLSAEYCIDSARVFSTGHSYGGFMTNRLGCSRADVLRAVAPVAGGPPFGGGSCEPAVAAWLTHGSNDDVVGIEMGISARDGYLDANSCGTTTAAVAPSPCVAYDGCVSGRPVHWCEHTDGHNWPSFAAQGIWDFFAQY